MSSIAEPPRLDSSLGTLTEVLSGLELGEDASPARKAVLLARRLQQRAAELQTPHERRQQAELERMVRNPLDKATLVQMTDQAFRSRDPHRAVDQLTHILDVQGVPRFFSRLDRALLRGFQSFGGYLPGVAVPLVKEKMREETANVVLPAEDEVLAAHLEARREAGLRMNVNFLGEAVLGEGEAERRLEAYLAALHRPEVECISVKISTLYSQISPLAFEHSVSVIADRIELLYRAAARMRFRRANGSEVSKLVYLDMEGYQDMVITAEAFMRALGRPGLDAALAGIALQAYIPDAYRVQQRILEWARRRVAAGGVPIMVRIVKGANMEMERVEASIRGWPQAPYQHKIDTDANFKRMLETGVQPDHIEAARLGVASHNLFDIAYALVLAVEGDHLDAVHVEMLEGMANHQRRALHELTPELLLYAPAARKQDFIHAIGYLIRRLDENTGPENFLRHAFRLEVGSPEWKRLEAGFLASFDRLETLGEGPRRTQDRRRAPSSSTDATPDAFVNEPDTDFALPGNIEWAGTILDEWRGRHGANAADLPVVIAGEELRKGRVARESLDPSRPGTVVARYREASTEDIDRALDTARRDPARWRETEAPERAATLGRAAHEIRIARAELMGAALAEAGKVLGQSDVEVSEAIDFCNYYRRSAIELDAIEGLEAHPRGVAVVLPPWNFPIAIPCGGVAGALAAGNTVILKPAPETVLVAWLVAGCFWRAGVPREALQFAPCAEEPDGTALATDSRVDVVILTGGTDTALKLLAAKPDMNLLAEAGGKDATVVTALSDREQAIKNVLQSAFGHGGQKCSATSLLILEEEIYDDPAFRETLCDAVASLHVGSAWDLHTAVGPLIRPPTGALERGLKELEPGETWALMPKHVGDDPNLYRPGVKWGVQPGSFTHMTELFGPVLGVMKARDLAEAIRLVNQTGYGLTSGLESLDDREQELWRSRVRAGNLYINRPTTGAIVLRQPFGGMGKSAFGPGIKAGGPNYVAQLSSFSKVGPVRVSDTIADEHLAELRSHLRALRNGEDRYVAERLGHEEIADILEAIGSYDLAVREEFGRMHDHFCLVGQDNWRRYLPVGELRVRLHERDTAFDLFARVCAARAAGCRVTVSHAHGHVPPCLEALERLTRSWGAQIEIVDESDDALAEVVREGHTERVRYAGPERVPECVLRAVGDSGIYIARAPVLAAGRIELLWYVREQSICHDYHRYGNLGARTREERAPVA